MLPMGDIATPCGVATAQLAYINHRGFGLPTSLGVMMTALAVSLIQVAMNAGGIAMASCGRPQGETTPAHQGAPAGRASAKASGRKIREAMLPMRAIEATRSGSW